MFSVFNVFLAVLVAIGAVEFPVAFVTGLAVGAFLLWFMFYNKVVTLAHGGAIILLTIGFVSSSNTTLALGEVLGAALLLQWIASKIHVGKKLLYAIAALVSARIISQLNYRTCICYHFLYSLCCAHFLFTFILKIRLHARAFSACLPTSQP